MTITKSEVLEALDSMDDFAKMDCGVDPIGARTLIENYIEQMETFRYFKNDKIEESAK